MTQKTIDTSQAAAELSVIIRALESTVASDKRIMEAQHGQILAHEAELDALRSESMMLRKIINEKEEKLMTGKYRYMELEKELWRLQGQAAAVMAMSRGGVEEKMALIRQRSALQSSQWTPSALSNAIADHERMGEFYYYYYYNYYYYYYYYYYWCSCCCCVCVAKRYLAGEANTKSRSSNTVATVLW